jgi:hypothetical protein
MESYRHVINDAAVRGYQNLMTAVRSSTELSARLLGSGITKRVGHSTRSPNMTAIGIAAEFARQLSILNTK